MITIGKRKDFTALLPIPNMSISSRTNGLLDQATGFSLSRKLMLALEALGP